jgi:membrane protein implicated in regulation of membrane protease activity
MANPQLVFIALVSIAIGVLCGVLVVIVVKLWRKQHVIDSLIVANEIVGLSGTVEIPFDRQSKGKVRITTKGSTIDLIACTDTPKTFQQGDRVFIVEMKGNKVWVIPEEYLTEQDNQLQP